jgi:hypothetical protein
MYIWVFSRSEGAGRATTRKTLGLTFGDPLDHPTLSGCIAALEHDDGPYPLLPHPELELDQLGMQLVELGLVLLGRQFFRFGRLGFNRLIFTL